jgi:hypothetical protein
MEENIWTADDLMAGLCGVMDVGAPKPPPPPPKQQISIDDLVEGSISHETQEEFNAWAKANPGVYFPMLAKHNLARDLKEPPKPKRNLEEYSLAELDAMSSNDIKRLLLRDKG